MNNSSVLRPLPGTLDWHASIAFGWDSDSGEEPPFSFGELTHDLEEYGGVFQKLIDDVAQSRYAHLLIPTVNIAEPEFFPEVANPSNEKMVVIDPAHQNETGLVPKAALWQSGWRHSMPYVFVRESVYKRLTSAIKILREFNSDLSLCITDGWRSIDQQTDLYTSFYPNGHVEGEPLYVSPSNTEDRFASPHPSGGAVDVLIGIGDQAIRIGSDLDYMDVEANTDHFENELYEGHIIKMMRRLFSNLKCEVGFVTLDSEWWHVEYGTRRWAGKTGQDPLYGNATIDLSLYEGIEPVVPIARSRRAAMSS